jgi:antitoxin HicB
MYTYPVTLEPDDNDTFLVTFPDVPGAITYGDTEDEALARAVDALETMLIGIMGDRLPIPAPSPVKRGGKSVTLPPSSVAKVALYQAMRETSVGKAELARRLNCHLMQIDRLLDLRHASRLEQIDNALRAVGKRLEINISDAA